MIILEHIPFYNDNIRTQFDEKRARTPRWVIRFTSKLQVKKKN
jgi:hypothetical protein